ncbi:MAG: hypothetical protein AAFZ15_23090 [Bacteroidota bacterium]
MSQPTLVFLVSTDIEAYYSEKGDEQIDSATQGFSVLPYKKQSDSNVFYTSENVFNYKLNDFQLQKGIHLHWNLPRAFVKALNISLIREEDLDQLEKNYLQAGGKEWTSDKSAFWNDLQSKGWIKPISETPYASVLPQELRTSLSFNEPVFNAILPHIEAFLYQIRGKHFPSVPDLWSVNRTSPSAKSWVVESSYISTTPPSVSGIKASTTDGVQQAYAPTIPFIKDSPMTDPSTTPFRYLGRQVEASSWSASGFAADKANHLKELTAIGFNPQDGVLGHGEFSFAAYYPNCNSVFGLYDSDATSGTNTYEIMGIYANPNMDCLRIFIQDYINRHQDAHGNIQISDANLTEIIKTYDPATYKNYLAAEQTPAIQKKLASYISSSLSSTIKKAINLQFNLELLQAISTEFSWSETAQIQNLKTSWEAEYTSNNITSFANVVNAASPSLVSASMPQSMVCAGKIQMTISGTSAKEVSLAGMDIALGNTGSEALSAYLAQKVAAKTSGPANLIEEQLEALQLTSKLKGQDFDLGLKFKEARHSKGFKALPGGLLWNLRLVSTKAQSAKEKNANEKEPLSGKLPPAIGDMLNEINLLQKQYDLQNEQIESLREQLFYDWTQFLQIKYGGGPGGDGGGNMHSDPTDSDNNFGTGSPTNTSTGAFGPTNSPTSSPTNNTNPSSTATKNLRKYLRTVRMVDLNKLVAETGYLHVSLNEKGQVTKAIADPAEGEVIPVAQQLADAINQLIGKLNLLNNSALFTSAGQAFVVQKIGAPRYWSAHDPTVLFVAPADYKMEENFVPSIVSKNASTPTILSKNLTTGIGPASLAAAYAQIASDYNNLGSRTWGENGFKPLKMDWEATLFPMQMGGADEALNYQPDFINWNYRLKENQPDFVLENTVQQLLVDLLLKNLLALFFKLDKTDAATKNFSWFESDVTGNLNAFVAWVQSAMSAKNLSNMAYSDNLDPEENLQYWTNSNFKAIIGWYYANWFGSKNNDYSTNPVAASFWKNWAGESESETINDFFTFYDKIAATSTTLDFGPKFYSIINALFQINLTDLYLQKNNGKKRNGQVYLLPGEPRDFISWINSTLMANADLATFVYDPEYSIEDNMRRFVHANLIQISTWYQTASNDGTYHWSTLKAGALIKDLFQLKADQLKDEKGTISPNFQLHLEQDQLAVFNDLIQVNLIDLFIKENPWNTYSADQPGMPGNLSDFLDWVSQDLISNADLTTPVTAITDETGLYNWINENAYRFLAWYQDNQSHWKAGRFAANIKLMLWAFRQINQNEPYYNLDKVPVTALLDEQWQDFSPSAKVTTYVNGYISKPNVPANDAKPIRNTTFMSPSANIAVQQSIENFLSVWMLDWIFAEYCSVKSIPSKNQFVAFILKNRLSEFNGWAVAKFEGTVMLKLDNNISYHQNLQNWVRDNLSALVKWSVSPVNKDSWFDSQNEEDKLIWNVLLAYQELLNIYSLSQTLGGFNRELIQRHIQWQLPVADPVASPLTTTTTIQTKSGGTKTKTIKTTQFINEMAKAVGRSNIATPEPEGWFLPLRSGQFQLDTLTLTNNFGKMIKLPANGNYIKISNYSETINLGTSSTDRVYIPPRLAQPARLNLRWLSADNGLQEMNAHPATSPICGWILPNNLDNSLMFYNGDGQALGAITQNPDFPWMPAPGSKTAVSLEAIPNPYLRSVARQILDIQMGNIADGKTEEDNYLSQLIDALDSALEYIEPFNFVEHQDLALLIGRPIAVARVFLQLDIQGLPATDQSTQMLTDRANAAVDPDSETTAHQPQIVTTGGTALYKLEEADPRKVDAKFENVRFPVRLGEHRMLNDGLVGYWLEDEDQSLLETFYSPVADPVPVKNAFIKTYIDHPLNLQVTANGSPVYATLLVDPRGKVHATSGILPTKVIEIPKDQYQTALQNISVTFLTAPILSPVHEFQLPIPKEPGFHWSWVENEGNRIWREVSEFRTVVKADFTTKFPNLGGLWEMLHKPGLQWLDAQNNNTSRVVPTDQRTQLSTFLTSTADTITINSQQASLAALNASIKDATKPMKAYFDTNSPQYLKDFLGTFFHITPIQQRQLADAAQDGSSIVISLSANTKVEYLLSYLKSQTKTLVIAAPIPPASLYNLQLIFNTILVPAPQQSKLTGFYQHLETAIDRFFTKDGEVIGPVSRKASFDGPQMAKEGWLKLTPNPEETNT